MKFVNPSKIKDFLNIRSVVITIYSRFIAALKACTVNVEFPSIVTKLWNENEVEKFVTLAI